MFGYFTPLSHQLPTGSFEVRRLHITVHFLCTFGVVSVGRQNSRYLSVNGISSLPIGSQLSILAPVGSVEGRH